LELFTARAKMLEGAAKFGGKIFWIGSHSNNNDREFRPDRQHLFVIQVKRRTDGKFASSAAGFLLLPVIPSGGQSEYE
jgi:hypothetical protein